MRIIAGTKRGMNLASVHTQVTRPITDRIKESLFNVLQNCDLLAGARVADLFCGVGSLGLEALSRGAAFATFVETDAEVAAVLEKNIARAGFVRQSRVIRSSAYGAGAPVVSGGGKHDLAFVDPPYATTRDVGRSSSLAGLLGVLEKQVAAGGIVVVRTHESAALLDDYGLFRAVDRRRWGTMAIVLLQARSDE